MSEAARAENTNITLTTQEDESKDSTPIESGFIYEMFAEMGQTRKENDNTINKDDY